MRPLETLMQNAIVVMPTLRRPEFLALSLEKLSQTPQSDQLDVRIYLDWSPNSRIDEVEYARDTYFSTAEIFQAKEHAKVLSGCWNILNALKAGYEADADLVFLVEEDVMVKPEFFQWHLSRHANNDYFVTCGRHLKGFPFDFYSNPGTCYSRAALDLIVPHINDDFFRDTAAYLNKTFPSMIGMDGTLDDGLIRKVQRSVNGKVLCAEPAVAVHQGFAYYDRLNEYRNHGKTLPERIENLKAILARVKPTDRYAHDFETF